MANSRAAAEFGLGYFDVRDPQHARWAVELWNDGTGGEIPITERFIRYNLSEDAGVVRRGRFAYVDGHPVGFVLCSAFPGAPASLRSDVAGWVEAIAVASSHQRRGIGRALLSWAGEWLVSADSSHAEIPFESIEDGEESGPEANAGGERRIRVGGGLRPFVPGALAGSAAEALFLACGFEYERELFSWDVARPLSDYRPPVLQDVAAAARPGQPGQEVKLLGFLAREFPGRWHWQAERFLEEGGRISDYMLLWTEEGVQGSCRLTFEDSVGPIDRFFPYDLPRPWAQLGSIGVSAHLRGQGIGIYLLDAGLRRLHNSGVNGCVIDWTTLLAFYGKCGFEPYRKWAMLTRAISEG